MRTVLIICTVLWLGPAAADPRLCGQPPRAADGTIERSSSVVRAFRRDHPCPSTQQRTGPCPGWRVDHVIPLACGGCDRIDNMQWLPLDMWMDKSRWERNVYGGRKMSKGCP